MYTACLGSRQLGRSRVKVLCDRYYDGYRCITSVCLKLFHTILISMAEERED